MKNILKILILLLSLFSFSFSYAADSKNSEGKIDNVEIGNTKGSNGINNPFLEQLKGDRDINVGNDGEQSIKELLVVAARDLKVIFLLIAGVYFLILVIRILFVENSEEESANFKKGLIWITIGIILMQISYYFVNTLYAQEVNSALANKFTENIIEPIIEIIETATAFFFMLVAIIAYYKMIANNGNADEASKGKISILYAIIGFIVVKIARVIILTTYGQINCQYDKVANIFGGKCAAESSLSEFSQLVVDIINWLNGFVGIVVILMIIYAGVQVLFAGGDEEKLQTAKKTIIYIIVGLVILVLNYFILSFYIIPEGSIN